VPKSQRREKKRDKLVRPNDYLLRRVVETTYMATKNLGKMEDVEGHIAVKDSNGGGRKGNDRRKSLEKKYYLF